MNNANKNENGGSKVRNYRTRLLHKNSMRIPEHYKEQKKIINVNLELDSISETTFEDINNY